MADDSGVTEADSGARGDGTPSGNVYVHEDAGSPRDGGIATHALDHDAATNAAPDAGGDAATNAASDAGHDASVNGGSDAGMDAGPGGDDAGAGTDDAGTETVVCAYAISPPNRVVNPCSAAMGTLTVTVTAGCTWSAISSEGATGWLRVTSGAGPHVGTGAGQTLNYSITTNRHQDARAGTITVLDESASPTTAAATVSQSAGHACP